MADTDLRMHAWGDGVFCVDSNYVRPGFDAIHLLIESGRAAVIDTGTQHSVPAVLAGLAVLGLEPDCVDWVVLTHVHLDHAGGAGALMQCLPRARLVVHPRGAPHMIDPSRLWAATEAVYGAEQAAALYCALVPVPAERVETAGDGHRLTLAGRTLECLDAPGHARHHLVLRDHATGHLFTGDTFGIAYREFDVAGQPFVFPSSTPTQFDPVAMRQTLERLLALDPEAVYLTHWSRLDNLAHHGAHLMRLIDRYTAMAQATLNRVGSDPALLGPALEAGMAELILQALREHGCTLPDATVHELLDIDLRLNAAGLLAWLGRA